MLSCGGGYRRCFSILREKLQLARSRRACRLWRLVDRHRPEALDVPLLAAQGEEHHPVHALGRPGLQGEAEHQPIGQLCQSAWNFGSSAASVQVVVMRHGSGAP